MLRWIYGVTKLDRMKNERIRGIRKVIEISAGSRGDDDVGKRCGCAEEEKERHTEAEAGEQHQG